MKQRRGFNLQPARPVWGVHPPLHREMSMQRGLSAAPLPSRVIIPVDQSLGVSAAPLVRTGQRVRTGELIAAAPASQATHAASIHASISGHVTAIEPRHVAGGDDPKGLCVVIENDGLDERHPDCRSIEPFSLPPQEIIQRIAEGGIVGLGGALFDTAEKLRGARELFGLILNGAECEPYITCDEMLMRERADAIVQGALIMMRALGDTKTVIALENDMPEARVALHDAIDAREAENIDVAVVTAKYPAGGERQLIEMITGREVPADGLPADIGYLCHNVATAAAVADLFATGEPLISRVVTLSGECIAQPGNFVVRIGTLITDLVAANGGYAGEVSRLVMGGPMMGIALPRDDVPITKATNCLVALPAVISEAHHPERPCIRCAECSEVCPARLLPQQLLVACRSDDMEALDELGLDACIECGCCDYVCPSFIPLTARFAEAKQTVRAHKEKRRQAARAHARFEARQKRLAREEAELAVDLQQQVSELGEADAIDTLMARVARKDENSG